MTKEEILTTFDFVEKEDLLVWPDQCIADLDAKNVQAIIDFLANEPISGEELFVLDLPAFLYPVKKFITLWRALSKAQGRGLANDIREEEITPSDEFPRLDKK